LPFNAGALENNQMCSDISARGGFFAVDSRVWAWLCQQGMNLAVAYLVLARGTGPDKRGRQML